MNPAALRVSGLNEDKIIIDRITLSVSTWLITKDITTSQLLYRDMNLLQCYGKRPLVIKISLMRLIQLKMSEFTNDMQTNL